MTLAYIGVGSNLGDRENYVNLARSLLEKKGISIQKISPLYEIEALCKPGQTMNPFLNGVFELETSLGPESLLNLLEQVERELGRTSKGDWKPRPIDLDLLFYGNEVVEEKRLQIPHPEIQNREFVLKPMVDLNPELLHPILRKTIGELYANLH